MFNLIVGTGTQNARQSSMTASRVFEHTEEHIVERFKPNGRLDVPALMALPTLFMEEGTTNEPARVGWLSRITSVGRDYQFQYTFDPDIPTLTNADIYAMSAELQMTDWEFSRNHWAVKEVDLSYQLLKAKFAQAPRPTVFQLSDKPVQQNLVSLMMPFSGAFGAVHAAIKGVVEPMGYECRRADDFWLHAHIMQDIVELISTSAVIICDLSGKNPNVFYEAGIAHTLGKEVILITQHMDDVPFDLRALRCITYHNNSEGVAKLAHDVAARLQTIASR